LESAFKKRKEKKLTLLFKQGCINLVKSDCKHVNGTKKIFKINAILLNCPKKIFFFFCNIIVLMYFWSNKFSLNFSPATYTYKAYIYFTVCFCHYSSSLIQRVKQSSGRRRTHWNV